MAQFNNKQQVIRFFEQTGAKRFKIFTTVRENLTGIAPLFECEGTTKTITEKLESILDLLEEGGDSAIVYSLHCFPKEKSEQEDKGTKNVCSFVIAKDTKNASVGSMQNIDSVINAVKEANAEIVTALKNDNIVLKQKLAAIEADDDDDEPIEETPLNKVINGLAPLIPVLIERFISNVKMPTNMAGASVNGVNDLQLNDIVNELQKKDPELKAHLKKLLDMANEEPEKFKVLLTYL